MKSDEERDPRSAYGRAEAANKNPNPNPGSKAKNHMIGGVQLVDAGHEFGLYDPINQQGITFDRDDARALVSWFLARLEKQPLGERRCPECHEVFMPQTLGQAYCSGSCGSKIAP